MIMEVSGAVAMVAIIGTFVYKYEWEGISPWDLLQSTEGDWSWWIDYYRLLENCYLRIQDWGYHSIVDPEQEESSSSDGMWWIERYYSITTTTSSSSSLSSWYGWLYFFNDDNSTELA